MAPKKEAREFSCSKRSMSLEKGASRREGLAHEIRALIAVSPSLPNHIRPICPIGRITHGTYEADGTDVDDRKVGRSVIKARNQQTSVRNIANLLNIHSPHSGCMGRLAAGSAKPFATSAGRHRTWVVRSPCHRGRTSADIHRRAGHTENTWADTANRPADKESTRVGSTSVHSRTHTARSNRFHSRRNNCNRFARTSNLPAARRTRIASPLFECP